MDYTGIVKRAWSIVWRYKILWLFGIFVGSSGGSGNGGSGVNYSTGPGEIPGFPVSSSDVERWFESNIGLLIAIGAFLILLGLGLWIISIAAKGGLIHLVREAEEDRAVSGWQGWSVGFRFWGRVFLINLILTVPMLLLIFILVLTVLVPIIVGFGGDAAAAGAGIGACGILALGVPLLIVGGIVLTVLETYASRFGVLLDMGAIQSIREAWRLIRSRFKETALMFLINFGISIAFGIAAIIVVAVFIAGGLFATLASESATPVIIAVIITVLLLAVPGGIYGAFVSALWTLTFRDLTGAPIATASVPPQAPGTFGGMPPAPPMPPVPGAPPIAPPAPPAGEGVAE